MWWLRFRDLSVRDVSLREGRGGRGAGKTGAAPEKIELGNSRFWALGLGVLVLVLHLVLFPPVPRLDSDFPEVGHIASQEIRAPFTFQAPLLEQDIHMRQIEEVVVEPPVLRSLGGPAWRSQDSRMTLWLEALGQQLGDTTATTMERVEFLNLQFPHTARGDLRRLFQTDGSDSLVERMELAWRRVMSSGVADMLPAGKYTRVLIKAAKADSLRGVEGIVTQSNVEGRLTQELRVTGLDPIDAVEAASVMKHFINPNLIYLLRETQARHDFIRGTVPTTREFSKGERIVDQGVRVTEEQALFLAHLESLIRARGGGLVGLDHLSRLMARALLIILGFGLFAWLGLTHFRERLQSIRFLLVLAIILVLFLLGASLALDRPNMGPMAVPIILLSLLGTVLYKETVGYTLTLLAVALLAVLPEAEAGSVFSWFLLGNVSVISLRRVQKRSQYYQTMLLLTLLSVVLIYLLGTGLGSEYAVGGGQYLVGFFAPVLMVLFGLFLLQVVEPVVGVCSDLTLTELLDLNHPLLQRMALEAQGTYHHSQVVGQLAEHAARSIDANALLTRVGALFHDIGKMQKPEYYVENQRPDFNKHDELSPSMSSLVISAHVKEGLELGRRWRLPQQVLDFIPEHHGTMVMEYFYHKALESDGNVTVKVDDFRYPGPKPQSRETALLMLADAVEAATRSLAKPTPSRIREITKQIIDKRMLSGQLDESGLTLSDLARSREAFIPLLTGIHHARIVYPGQKERDQDRVPERKGERKV
ncbi:MAG: HDIG domain-containing protein [Gemmatimonadales bacterium]|nr:HDIG domain-containing protein [Gemmatimonadales bacterium]